MAKATDERTRYVAGLSLGPAGMFTGLSVLEKHCRVATYGSEADASYAVRHLQRFPPGTPYAQVVEALRAVFAEPPARKGTLVVDQTGVGRPVFESVRDAGLGAAVRGLTVTAGHAAAPDERGGWLVPKKDLVGVLQVLLQEKRLKVAQTLEHARTLTAELHQFQLKAVPLKPDALEWRERPHDDLVLAVASAAWCAERPGPAFFFTVVTPDPPPRSPNWCSPHWQGW
jgi:hypothetical protein